MNDAPIGVFDSGVGGVSVLKTCLDVLPNENFVYLADRSGMPYGNKSHEEIEKSVELCVRTLQGEGVKAVVAACNTATNVGIASLRKKYDMPFVGLEPAVKPAVAACTRGNVLVLLTPLAAKQEKFRELVKKHDNGRLIIAPQEDLAEKVEEHIDDFRALKKPTFDVLRAYKNVECVVLGCTHYVFLRPLVEEFYGGRIKIFDGNDGAARRLKTLLEQNGKMSCLGRRSLKFIVI